MKKKLDIVVLGLSITSSWGNGHATTFRGLIKELHKNGHAITFFERDVPWYASNRDLLHCSYCKIILYNSIEDLKEKYEAIIANAHLVIVGSYVPDGVEVGRFVTDIAGGITAFYDIDTPVTMAKLRSEDYEYLHPDLIPLYDVYLSFTGGETLQKIEEQFGSPMAKAFYCSFDPLIYYPEETLTQWDLGYLGTYSTDRQAPLNELMLNAASDFQNGKFVVAGPKYPSHIQWSQNVQRIEHLPPAEHRRFYNSQRFTLNITRTDMIEAGYSPSVRLFEAAACGIPIISDYWNGIESIFEPGQEILISSSAKETLYYLQELSEQERVEIGLRARQKVLQHHTAMHRAIQLENYYNEVICQRSAKAQPMES